MGSGSFALYAFFIFLGVWFFLIYIFKQKKNSAIVTYLGSLITSLTLVVIASFLFDRMNKKEDHIASQTLVSVQSTNNLGITYQEFVDRFNQVAEDKSLSFRMNSDQTKWSDHRDAFSNLVNENVVISGTFNDDNLKEIIIIGSGYGSKSTLIAGGNMLLSFCAVAETLSTKTKNPCNQIVDLMDTALNKIDKESTSIIIDDIRYSMSASKEKGMMLYIEKYNSNMKKTN